MMRVIVWFLVASGVVLFAQTPPQTPNIGLYVPAHNTYNWDSWYNLNWANLDLQLAGALSLKAAGAKGDGSTDDAAAINAALTHAAIVDGGGLTYKVNSAITVPTSVTLRNLTLTAGTAGMNVVLVNNYSRLLGVKIVGTGTTNIVERGIYNAGDAVSGVWLDNVEVSNLTVGIQAQPYGTNNAANTPRKWYINAFVHDIVGKVGNSEGYGVLLSPANECEIHLRALNIQRHALYLSAGAQLNVAWVDADTTYNEGVQLYATSTQPPVEQNTVHVRCRNIQNAPGQSGMGYCVVVVQNANQNRLYVDSDGTSGLSDGAVLVQGDQATAGWHPTNNTIEARSKGNYLGFAVLSLIDAINTQVVNSVLVGRGTGASINFNTAGGNAMTANSVGAVLNSTIDGVDSAGWGITLNHSAANGPLNLRSNRVFNVAGPISGAGPRIGYNKIFITSVTFTSVATLSAQTQAVTFPETFTNPRILATVATMSPVTYHVTIAVTGFNTTTANVVLLNGSAVTETATAHVVVYGD